jgi:multidrug efflux pump subunit AcrA (membrane-fusion protein)
MGGAAALAHAAAEQQVVAAPIATVQAEDVVRRMQIPGSVRAEQEVILHAQANGFVTAITRNRGDRVAAGDLIATLELAVEREVPQATLALADAELRRLDANRALGKPAVTDQDLDVQRAKHATVATATLTTPIVLPAVFALIQSQRSVRTASLDPDGAPAA